MYDVVLRGGRVIDPATGFDDIADVGIVRGRIGKIERHLTTRGVREYDVTGCIVCPGLIDFHTHVFWGGAWGINPDEIGPRTGVTTFVDFGTAGPSSFVGFVEHVIKRSRVRVLAYLHIAYNGLEGAVFDPDNLRILGELEDLRRAAVAPAIQVGRRFSEIIRGIKVRASVEATGAHGVHAVFLARQVAEVLGKPLAVHIGQPPPTVQEVLPLLRPGDVLTHMCRGPINSLLDVHGQVIEEAKAARLRGVLFDVGHGQGSFSFEIAKALLAQGFPPDIISTDIHAYNINGPVYDLPTTMSKFLALGVDLPKIIKATTWTPAVALGLSRSLGSLQEGYEADIAVLRIEQGTFYFRDTCGQQLEAPQRLVPVMTFKGGDLLWGDMVAHV
jgi:dihydroorotase